MSPNFGPSPTPPAWNTAASTGVTPKPTLSPLYQQHNGLLRRDTAIGKNTCGWINGDPNQPFTCDPGETCVADDQYTAFGCCDSIGDCAFTTSCIDSDPGVCIVNEPGDCFHYDWIVGCVGDWGCITYVIPGDIPFSSADCDYTPGTVTIDSTYAGGPADQQIPMPLTEYLVAASSASSASAAEASSTSSSGSSDDSAASDWMSHHMALLIGVIAGAAVLLLLCCCFGIFRRKKRSRARPIPARAGGPPPQYYYVPQQDIQGRRQDQGQENYPMIHFQYDPNK